MSLKCARVSKPVRQRVDLHLRSQVDLHLILQCSWLRNVSGKKKTNKHKHFGRDGVRDRQEPSLGQTGPLPGTNWDLSLGQTGLFLFNSTVKSPFCPVCPWTGGGSSLGQLSHKGRHKSVYVFSVYWFFRPPMFSHIHVKLAEWGGTCKRNAHKKPNKGANVVS